MKVIPETNWEPYSFNTKNGVVFSSFYAGADKIAQDDYPHSARVIITIKQPGPSGGPDQPETQVLWDMEDALTDALQERGVQCVMPGRLTLSGKRELVFQLHDWETFRPPVAKWLHAHPDYKIEIFEGEGWKFFFEFVWPSEDDWMFIYDRRVVESLTKSGSDPAKPHSLEFVFDGEPAPLEQMRDRLAARSYALLEFSPAGKRLIMTKSMPLDACAIVDESIAHRRDAKELGIDYNGWGCSVVK